MFVEFSIYSRKVSGKVIKPNHLLYGHSNENLRVNFSGIRLVYDISSHPIISGRLRNNISECHICEQNPAHVTFIPYHQKP